MRLLLAVILLSLLAAPSFAEGDATRGKEIARAWCAGCHVVEPSPTTTAIDGAPPFATIAARAGRTDDYLRAWLFNPHPPMPNLNLGPRAVDDLVSYIDSLRQGE